MICGSSSFVSLIRSSSETSCHAQIFVLQEKIGLFDWGLMRVYYAASDHCWLISSRFICASRRIVDVMRCRHILIWRKLIQVDSTAVLLVLSNPLIQGCALVEMRLILMRAATLISLKRLPQNVCLLALTESIEVLEINVEYFDRACLGSRRLSLI